MPSQTILQQNIIDRILKVGPISFRDFMEIALYDPDHGYYNTEQLKIGADGDYYTSSNVHPVFGGILAEAFVQLLPNLTTLLEFGAGTGQLAFDIITSIRDDHPEIFENLNYTIVETSPIMQKRQKERLVSFEGKVRWQTIAELRNQQIRGIIFSNEFVDALPFHRVRSIAGKLEELFLDASRQTIPERFEARWQKPSSDGLQRYVERIGVELREQQEVEINLDAIEWLTGVSQMLREGHVVTIDYGDLARDLWTPQRRHGTIRSFRNHRLVDSPYEFIGEQDITASVNFTALIEYGRDLGLDTISFERQTAFLMRMGIIERITEIDGSRQSLEDLKSRLAIKNLVVPGGISDSFRVLIQKR